LPFLLPFNCFSIGLGLVPQQGLRWPGRQQRDEVD